MILFETCYNEIFNLTIYHLLKSESKKGIDNIIEEITPKYLRREQFNKCVATFTKFVEWMNDDYYHHLVPLTKVLLYQFLNRSCMQSALVDLKKNKFFQSKLKIVTANYILKEEDINKNLYDVKWYINNLFVDKYIIDIISLEDPKELKIYLKNKSIDISVYSEILPLEIQKSLKKDIYLYQNVKELINFIQEKINFGNLTQLFWFDNLPKSESKIQEVLVCLFNAYFHSTDIDINRETLIGNGKIDFKFYRHYDDKVLIEIKKANRNNLELGYEKQLLEYMNACKFNYGYLDLCQVFRHIFSNNSYRI